MPETIEEAPRSASLEERKREIPTTTKYARAPELLTQTRPRPDTRSTPPELQISISLHLRIYAPAAHLQSSRAPYFCASYTSLHPQRTTRAPDLHTSMRPTCPYTRSTPPDLHTLRLHVYTPASHLQSSGALEANTSTSPGPQHGARGTRSLVTSHEGPFVPQGISWHRCFVSISVLGGRL